MVLTRWQRRLRVFIKRFLYSQLYLRESLFIMFGKAKPIVRFVVEQTPPSIYLNWEIAPDQVAALENELDLPYPLTPLHCLEGEEPFYCLTLNMYRVSGLANGIRAEWSLYVRDSGGTPRYLVIEAKADSGAVDSVDLITRGSDVGYEDSGERFVLHAVAADGGRFEARIPKRDDAPRVRAHPEWVEANDYIYWLTGICDRTFYDSGLANARTRQIPSSEVEISDETRWGRFVEPTPRHVIVFEDAIEFAMSPWWNLDDLPR
jgi:hypothetical protein